MDGFARDDPPFAAAFAPGAFEPDFAVVGFVLAFAVAGLADFVAVLRAGFAAVLFAPVLFAAVLRAAGFAPVLFVPAVLAAGFAAVFFAPADFVAALFAAGFAAAVLLAGFAAVLLIGAADLVVLTAAFDAAPFEAVLSLADPAFAAAGFAAPPEPALVEDDLVLLVAVAIETPSIAPGTPNAEARRV